MAADKNNALRDGQANYFGGLWDNGTFLLREGVTTISTHTFAADAFPTVSAGAGQLTAAWVSATVTAGASTTTGLDNAQMISNGSTYQLTGLTVGTSGTNVIVDSVDVTSGQDVTINTFTWTESDTV